MSDSAKENSQAARVLFEISSWLDGLTWDSDSGENEAANYAEDLRQVALWADLAAQRVPETPSTGEMICSCGTIMICPDIGCDKHKLSALPSAETPEK